MRWDEAGARVAGLVADDGRAVSYRYDGAGRLVKAVAPNLWLVSWRLARWADFSCASDKYLG